MGFDASAAKLLQPGDHIMVDGCPGLRLVATATRRTWTYRYKSPVDGRMRQVAIGPWPATSSAAATVAWEAPRQRRDAGEDPAQAKRQAVAAFYAFEARENVGRGLHAPCLRLGAGQQGAHHGRAEEDGAIRRLVLLWRIAQGARPGARF